MKLEISIIPKRENNTKCDRKLGYLYVLSDTRLRKVKNFKLKDSGRAALAADYSVLECFIYNNVDSVIDAIYVS